MQVKEAREKRCGRDGDAQDSALPLRAACVIVLVDLRQSDDSHGGVSTHYR
jgi:hypothetical protein